MCLPLVGIFITNLYFESERVHERSDKGYMGHVVWLRQYSDTVVEKLYLKNYLPKI